MSAPGASAHASSMCRAEISAYCRSEDQSVIPARFDQLVSRGGLPDRQLPARHTTASLMPLREEGDVSLTLDDLDRAILGFLGEDGRMSSAEMARRLGCVSARAVRRRINKLIETGIVTVKGELVPKALGYEFSANISVEVESGRAREVAEAMLKRDNINYVSIVTGESDLILGAIAADLPNFQRFMLEELQRIPGVQRTKTHIIAEILETERDWRVPEELP